MLEKVYTLLDGVIANGSGEAYHPTRNVQSFQGSLSNTTTPSATVTVEVSNDGALWTTLGTLSLSGAQDTDGLTSNAAWVSVRGTVSGITGTDAAVTLNVAY
jgi:hypothetical protein